MKLRSIYQAAVMDSVHLNKNQISKAQNETKKKPST